MNFLSYTSELLGGIYLTLILMVISLSVGFVLAICMTACSYTQNFLLTKIVKALQFFICGTPILVQIFLIYYGVGQFAWVRESVFWIALREPMICAIIALSINTACYTSVLLIGAIRSIPKNEIEACEAMGMSTWLAFRRIIFPRAFRIALPAYSNEVIMILKSTSLASTITLLEIMGVTQAIIAETYEPVTLYLVAAGIYLVLNFFIMGLFNFLRCRYVNAN
jgi:arginine transport system permease protein